MTTPAARSGAARVALLPAALMNALGAALLLALAVWLWLGAADIETTGDGALGADSFPRLVAALLGAGCLALLAQSVRGMMAGAGGGIAVSRPLQVLAAAGLVCLYPALIGWLGYYLATPLWMAPFLVLAGMRSPLGIAASVAGFLLFTKVLFQMALAIPMP